ncbi:MAG: DNA polymerase III subunit chi [Rhodospirillaceae bacterium]
MTDIAFYHLERSPLEQALPKLLEKTLEAGKRALVMVSSEERAEGLAQALWTYDAGSWLPHGTQKDGNPEDQPVWITTEPDNPNKATFLFLADGATHDWVDSYERAFELFDGHDDDAVKAARGRWKAYKDAGHVLTYWQQSSAGKWEKKS